MTRQSFYRGRLPFLESIAKCYEALDLRYGAPMDEVTQRYEDYLEKCHPDRHTDNPVLLADAYKLTGILTWAHGRILEAWQQYGVPDTDLPYDPELARSYDALDLPYGAPIEEVTRRWKVYLKTVHPDLHAGDAEKWKDANTLTQLLTRAYEQIKEAWKKQGR